MTDDNILRDEHTVIGSLLAKYPDLTPEERAVLDEWLTGEGNKQLFDHLLSHRAAYLRRLEKIGERTPERAEAYLRRIEGMPQRKLGWLYRWQTYAAAACTLLVLSLGAVWLFNKEDGTEAPNAGPVAAVVHDAAPGRFKAKLTLSDGSVVVLDSAANGQLARQGTTRIVNKDGQLLYEGAAGSGEVLYNTLSTGKGETYATVLSDGSKVWLNSQSSVRFPVQFSGDVRKVEITGEGYFEVAKAASQNGVKRPFVVTAPGMEVEVLGTHFNVNSYSDETTQKTTLLEGAVKVRSVAGSAQTVLQPGEQAQYNAASGDVVKVKGVDVDAAVAWRYGKFSFASADVPTVMRQLSRWYDMEVVYTGTVPKRKLAGRFPRNVKLSEILEVLKRSNVNFRIEGKTIIVSP